MTRPSSPCSLFRKYVHVIFLLVNRFDLSRRFFADYDCNDFEALAQIVLLHWGCEKSLEFDPSFSEEVFTHVTAF